MKILIVDNDQNNLEPTREQFSTEIEDKIIYCNDAYTARDMMCKEKFDLIATRYYWLEIGNSDKRAQYIPAGIALALDAYAVGVKSVIVKNNFMWREDLTDPNRIIHTGILFAKAYSEKMILTTDQCRGDNTRDQINWRRCIDHAIGYREQDNPEKKCT